MNKKLLVLIAAMISLFSVSAQYCGGSGTSVCTAPSTLPAVGFFPPYDSAACAVIGQPYDQTVFFLAPTTVTQGTTTYPLNYIIIDTVRNLPCGLCWRSGNSQNRINGGATGCVRVTGTTLDAVGQYKLRVIVTANVRVGLFNVNVGNQNAEDLGVRYYIRVQAPGGTCAPVDTLSAGRTTTTAGTITAPTISGNTNICPSQSTTLSVPGTYQTYVWSTGALTNSITVSTGGNYRVTVYNNCASATASVNVSVVTPTPTITPAGPINLCEGSSVTLDAGAGYSAYSWSNGATTRTISVNQTGLYNCTVTQSGCTGSGTAVSVSVDTVSPTITAGGPTTFCAGGNVTLDAGLGYNSYLWSTGATTRTINVTQSGSYSCTVTRNSCQGTSNIISVNVVNPQPVITPAGPISICTGNSTTLDAGAGFASYAWNTGATSQSISVSNGGNYSCTVTQSGCQGVATPVSVSVVTLTPQIVASGPTTFCSGGSVQLDAGNGYASYLWSNGAQTQTIVVSTAGDYDCTVTQNGCSAATSSISVIVTTNSLSPTVTPALVNVCPGGSATLNAGSGYDTYLWSNGATTQTISISDAGTYTVTVTQGSCSGDNSADVTNNNVPVSVTVTASSTSACDGDNITLTATAGLDDYLWSNGSTGFGTTAFTSGLYSVTASSNGCTGTDAVSVVFNPIPSVSLSPSGSQSVCAGESITIDAPSGYSSYSWNNQETTPSITVSNGGLYYCAITEAGCTGNSDTVSVQVVPNTLNPTISPAVAQICSGGTATLNADLGFDSYLWSNGGTTSSISSTSSGTYTVTVTGGVCSATATGEVQIVNTTVPVTISPSGNVSFCADQSVTLNAGTGFDSYTWTSGSSSATIQPTSSGVYGVTVTQNGCLGEDSVNVTVNPLPVLSIIPVGPVNACEGDAIQLTATANQGTYEWSNGLVTNSIVITNSGSYSVTATTAEGCSAASSNAVTVTLNTRPDAGISVQPGAGFLYTLNASPSGQNYTWQYAASDTTAALQNVGSSTTLSVNCNTAPGYYRVVVTGAGNCTDTSSFVTIGVCSGIDDVTTSTRLSLIPNPAKGMVAVWFESLSSGEVQLEMLDITGKKVLEIANDNMQAGVHKYSLDLNALAPGVYVVRVIQNGNSVYQRLVIE